MQKLSIVIPVYNTAIYLKECLESIINQTYSEIEIICVDDCSPDNSAEIIKEYAAKDSRIKYIKHTENKFQGGARNTGINAAEGSYITFVDSDDYMADKSSYENIIKKIEQYKTDIGIFSFFEIKNNTKKYYRISKSITGINNLNQNNFTKAHCSPCNKIFKLEDIKKYNLSFPEKLKFEDEAFWYKYVAALEPKAYIENTHYYAYRIRSGSTMDTRDKYIYDYLDITLDIMNYLKSAGKENYYKSALLNLLYSPAVSDEIYNLSEENRKIVADKFYQCIYYVGDYTQEMNERIGARIYAYFIDNKFIREKYIEEIKKLSKIKYKILKPNIFSYKLKREMNRIIMQIKNK